MLFKCRSLNFIRAVCSSKHICAVNLVKIVKPVPVSNFFFAMPPKRKAPVATANADEASEPKTKKQKNEENQKKKASAKTPIPDVSALDFTSDAKTKDGLPWNVKFASWNVNGLRAWLEKNGHSYITAENPDVFCVQETKCDLESIPEVATVPGYQSHWLAGDKDGYSGVGLYYKKAPVKITDGIGVEKHDTEGRVITAEYDHYYLVTVYVPNAGRGLVRHAYRTQEWDTAFRQYLLDLDNRKPVIVCGDLNVAHTEIDLTNPKTNKKNAGFTVEEREGFSKLLQEGQFIDSFRYLYPDKTGIYTFWTYMMNARAKNVGWRLDYFVVSQRLVEKNLCDSLIRTEVMGSDHCPVVCLMRFD